MNSKTTYFYNKKTMPKILIIRQGETYKLIHETTNEKLNNLGKVILK